MEETVIPNLGVVSVSTDVVAPNEETERAALVSLGYEKVTINHAKAYVAKFCIGMPAIVRLSRRAFRTATAAKEYGENLVKNGGAKLIDNLVE